VVRMKANPKIPVIAFLVAILATLLTLTAVSAGPVGKHLRHTAPTTTTTTTVASTTTSTTVPPAPAPPPPAQTVSAPSGWGCGPALAYLQAHADPSFSFHCTQVPGASIEGGQALTCNFNPIYCPHSQEIWIADPCPAAYMNEASNSWVLTGQSDAPIDPYGYCH